MKSFNVAIIGHGNVAAAHIAALNATTRARVTAVYSSRELAASELSARHGCTLEVQRDLAAMLARDDIHAVSICSRPDLHCAHAVTAARAGKHLIIEKPVALSPDEARRVADAVAAAGVKVCVCFEVRFSSQLRATKSVIEAGLLGRIHYGEIDYFHGIGPASRQYRWNTKKAMGGSSLLTAGCHAADALLWCMGGEVEAVTSHATHSTHPDFAAYEYPTTSVTVLRFTDGRIGKVASVIDCVQPYYFHTHLVGSEGSLLDDQFHSRRLEGLDRNRWSRLALNRLGSGDVRDHPYQAQFEAFFGAVARGEDMPLTNLSEALRTHRVVFAADRSAAEGRTVQLAELD